jgi:hypothetical protein
MVDSQSESESNHSDGNFEVDEAADLSSDEYAL